MTYRTQLVKLENEESNQSPQSGQFTGFKIHEEDEESQNKAE